MKNEESLEKNTKKPLELYDSLECYRWTSEALNFLKRMGCDRIGDVLFVKTNRLLGADVPRYVAQEILAFQEKLRNGLFGKEVVSEEVKDETLDVLAGNELNSDEEVKNKAVDTTEKQSSNAAEDVIAEIGAHGFSNLTDSDLNLSLLNYNFSVRALNALKINGCETLGDVLKLDSYGIRGMKNVGKKSAEEIRTFQRQYLLGNVDSIRNDDFSGKTFFELVWGQPYNCEECVFLDDFGNVVPEVKLDDVFRLPKIASVLKENGIKKFADLMNLTRDSFLRFKKVGSKSAPVVIDTIKKHTRIYPNLKQANESANKILLNFKTPEYTLEINEIYTKIINYLENKNQGVDDNFSELIHSPFFERLLIRHIRNTANRKLFLEKEDFDTIFPNELRCFQNEFLAMAEEKKVLKKQYGKYITQLQTFFEFVQTIENETDQQILVDSSKGYTLRELGNNFSISRERVRQRMQKVLNCAPRLYEDWCYDLFRDYEVEGDSVPELLKLDDYGKAYFRLKNFTFGKKSLDDFLVDEKIPREIRVAVEKYLHKDLISIDGVFISKSRKAIVDYLVKKECVMPTPVNAFQKKYDSFLTQNGLENDVKLQKYVSINLLLSKNPNILYQQGKTFRFFEITDDEFNRLLEEIDFYDLKDIEISTKYFFDRYPDVLRNFGIINEYELHNLLRKRIGESNEIEFLRMPSIKFGNVSRENQVLELARQEAPIGALELAEKYEMLYGVAAKSFLAAYVSCINLYYHRGVYSFDYKDLSADEFEYLHESLSDDCYEIAEVKRIFQKRFENADLEKINSVTLKKLGFRISAKIVYKYPRENFEEFFRNKLEQNDVVDFTNKRWLISVPGACNVLNQLKSSYDIFEFNRYRYVSYNRLKNFISGKEVLVSYVSAAINFEKKYFSLKSLKQHGFKHELDSLGFDDFFYISILKNSDLLTYHQIGTAYLFAAYPKKISAEDIVQDILKERKSIDVYECVDFLNQEYGINWNKGRLAEVVNNAGLFYSATMEKIYIDYDEFLGDL